MRAASDIKDCNPRELGMANSICGDIAAAIMKHCLCELNTFSGLVSNNYYSFKPSP